MAHQGDVLVMSADTAQTLGVKNGHVVRDDGDICQVVVSSASAHGVILKGKMIAKAARWPWRWRYAAASSGRWAVWGLGKSNYAIRCRSLSKARRMARRYGGTVRRYRAREFEASA